MPAANVRAAAAAVTFLTRVPIGRSLVLDAADVARGSLFFPVVGLGVGACVGAVAALLDRPLPSLAAAGVALLVALLLTGAMHLDALADVADAAGGIGRERALEIMRDSRVGSFGAAAISLDLLLKVVAISALLDRGGAFRALVVSASLSRAAAPTLAAVLPYPRPEGGPGSVLTGRVPLRSAVAGAVFATAAAAVIEGRAGLAMAAAVAMTALALAGLYRRWLGGATGDCLGAATEVGETVSLLVAVAVA
jgi:adenosylcobinamide-GDP ribazoletransferase